MGGKARPDVQGLACMNNCAGEANVASFLPDFARNQHGNLAEQNRPVGPQRGADTSQPEARAGQAAVAGATAVAAAPRPVTPTAAAPARPEASGADNRTALAMAAKYSCTACHGMAQKIVGPAFADIARRHAGKIDYLAGKIKAGGSGVWGPIPMPAQALSEAEARVIATWISSGAAK